MKQNVGNIIGSSVCGVNVSTVDNVTSRWNANNFLLIGNLLLLIINVYGACVIYPRTVNYGLDYMGIIVAILAVEVTLLIGLKLHDAITLEKKINRIIRESIAETANEAARCSSSLTLAQMGNAQFYKDDGFAFRSLFNALAILTNKSTAEEMSEDAKSNAVLLLKQMAKRGDRVFLESCEEKELFVETAKAIGDEELLHFARCIEIKL